MRRLFLLFFLPFVLLLFAGVYYYFGGFAKVEPDLVMSPKFTYVYSEYSGPYSGTAEAIADVELYLEEKAIPFAQQIGVYLDSPDSVASENLRSYGGVLVESPVDIDAEGYQNGTIEPQECVHAQFFGHPAIGPMKVYPKIAEYMAIRGYEAAGPTVEIYALRGWRMQIDYFMPVRKIAGTGADTGFTEE